MDYVTDGDTLTITIDEDEQRELAELQNEHDDIQSDAAMREFLEPLIANSELTWIDPSDTGDLTDAPMLGVLGEVSTEKTGPYGCVPCGCWGDKARFQPIVDRHAFMDYETRSPLVDLLKSRQVIFTKNG